jgi:hypothetical protein
MQISTIEELLHKWIFRVLHTKGTHELVALWSASLHERSDLCEIAHQLHDRLALGFGQCIDLFLSEAEYLHQHRLIEGTRVGLLVSYHNNNDEHELFGFRLCLVLIAAQTSESAAAKEVPVLALEEAEADNTGA